MTNNTNQYVFEKTKQAKTRVNHALIRINEEAKKVFRRENTIDYLNYMCDQIYFDIYTVLLLYMQPVKINQCSISDRSTYVETYNTWMKKDNPVQKGSTGILIVLPYLSKKINKTISEEKNDVSDEFTSSELITFYDLTTGTVFDVKQTNDSEQKNDYLEDVLLSMRKINKFKYEEWIIDILMKYLMTIDYAVYIESNSINNILKRIKSYSKNDKSQVQIIVRSNMDGTEIIERILYEFINHQLLNSNNSYLFNAKRDVIEFTIQATVYIIMRYFRLDNKIHFNDIESIEIEDKINILHLIQYTAQKIICNLNLFDKSNIPSIIEYMIEKEKLLDNTRLFIMTFMELTIFLSTLNAEKSIEKSTISKENMVEMIRNNLINSKDTVIVDYGNSLINKIDLLSQQELNYVISNIERKNSKIYYQVELK